jgi:hypothetical protein
MNPLAIKPALIAAGLALAIGFGGGWLVNGWRLSGAHQAAIAAMQKDIDLRDESIREQNKGVEAARAATASADERRKVAEKYAIGVIRRIDDQAAAVAASAQTTCDGVLREAWEGWQ